MSDAYGGARPPNFSQRSGIEPYPTALQIDDRDERARTDLWNYIYRRYLKPVAELISREGIWTRFLARYHHEYHPNVLANELMGIVTLFPTTRCLT